MHHRYEDVNEWKAGWKKSDWLIDSRVKLLQQSVDDQIHKTKRSLTYRLFSNFVDYARPFQGMEETLFNSAQLEGTSKVKFQTTEQDGKFHFSPYHIDSLGHICGFLMNATETFDTRNQVFINHGWENMRCATTFTTDQYYRTYVRMINVGGTMYSGDVYIFDDKNEVVGLYEGVKFQGISRQIINHVLPSPKGSNTAAAPLPKPVKAAPAPQVRKPAPVLASLPAPAPRQEASAAPVPSESKKLSKLLEIVADAIGISASELLPSSQFADLGVDSLMSLTITGQLREELDIDAPSSIFLECETVEQLTDKLGLSATPAPQFLAPPSIPSTSSSTTVVTPSESVVDEYTTDGTESDFEDLGDNRLAIIGRILAEEIGVTPEEVFQCPEFSELGLDSLMSLTVLGRLREEANLDLPANLFLDNVCMSQVAHALGIKGEDAADRVEIPVAQPPAAKPNANIPAASSILLQGNPKTDSKILFLFPDGSGAAVSYAPLPRIAPNVTVYGLNCPYQKNPEDFKCSLEELTAPYLAEIRRRQPHGPYSFGGWSAGGICAYDAAQELIRQGEVVEKLILIDSPFPVGLEKLPPRLYDFFSSIGMFGSAEGKQPPKWLVPHFLAFVDSLDKYRVKPFAEGKGPKTHIIWAKDGVAKYPTDPRPEPRDDDPREMRWLLENRKDFGPNGWDGLLGRNDLVIETMSDANHFSMMTSDKVKELARFLERAMA